jgi:hypothetical protein
MPEIEERRRWPWRRALNLLRESLRFRIFERTADGARAP